MNRLENQAQYINPPKSHNLNSQVKQIQINSGMFVPSLVQQDLKMDVNPSIYKGKIIVITGGSRGIGLQIALKLAPFKPKIALLAKTVVETEKYKGTIHSAAEQVKQAGAEDVLPIQCDVREEGQVKQAVEQIAAKFGGIDILINNASMLVITDTLNTSMKRYDLITSVNVRGTFMVSQYCIPYLKKSKHPHILNISPPINLDVQQMSAVLVETIAKYQMSMCVLGMATEFKENKICVNALWPKTTISTLAINSNAPGKSRFSLVPQIMADAAYYVLAQSFSPNSTGQFYLDDEVLISNDSTFSYEKYKVDQSVNNEELSPDLML